MGRNKKGREMSRKWSRLRTITFAFKIFPSFSAHCQWQTQFGLLAWVINFVVPLCLAMCFAVAKLAKERNKEKGKSERVGEETFFYINYFFWWSDLLWHCLVVRQHQHSRQSSIRTCCSIIHQWQGAFWSNLGNVCGNVCCLVLSPPPLRRSTWRQQ